MAKKEKIRPYKGYIELLAKKFEARLDDILTDYNFDYGVEFEIALCEILRDFLPQQFGICRGHVVSFEGLSEGDDIIIYDQQKFPTIRLHGKEEFSRKENIPIEAVYAYIEAKHSLNANSLSKAVSQIEKVKLLVSSRKKVEIEKVDAFLPPLQKHPDIKYSENYPDYRNPVYCAIVSRKTDFTKIELDEKKRELNSSINKTSPEIILFSNDDYFQIGYPIPSDFQPTLFLLETQKCSYERVNSESKCFGLFLANLIGAIDWIRLGRINWADVLNEYIAK